MKKILVLGAGKSSFYLLEYLSKKAGENGWEILVCDRDEASLSAHTSGFDNLSTQVLDITDETTTDAMVSMADLVVSLLPPAIHIQIARKCLKHGTHLATASYVSPEMRQLHEEAAAHGLVFLNEMGLDPGIDHMSAMRLLDGLRAKGAEITSFESYCGGLIVPEDCEGNPWQYKFSWNPMNVITAAQGGMSVYRQQGQERYIPFYQVFSHAAELEIPGYGILDSYANRDSLGYEAIYGLNGIGTMKRGTLRRSGFCTAWQVLVDLGFTDNTTTLHPSIISMGALCRALTGMQAGETLSGWLLQQGKITTAMLPWFDFLGAESDEVLTTTPVTPAVLLRLWLSMKWELKAADRDEVVLYHRVGYREGDRQRTVHSLMTVTGLDNHRTAMAKTVGYPLAMGASLILEGKLSAKGVCIPTIPELYNPVLQALAENGINITENE